MLGLFLFVNWRLLQQEGKHRYLLQKRIFLQQKKRTWRFAPSKRKSKFPHNHTAKATMFRFSNTVICLLNLVSLLASIPIIGAGLWLARSKTNCETFLQTPLLIIGFVILVVALAGFIGACFHVAWALWLYLAAMLFLIVALLGLTVFGLVVTTKGGGVEVPGRVYQEYRIDQYGSWLKNKVGDEQNWRKIRRCLLRSESCSKFGSWTTLDYVQRDMSPIQSGCCKPPTSCNNKAAPVTQDPDCSKWRSEPNVLCYDCDSCKGGVLEEVRRDSHKITILNIVILVLLIGVYAIGCCAYRNVRRAETDYPHGQNEMTRMQPRCDYYWWRWWYDRKERYC